MHVAFLGTGLLGYPMAERLCAAGHDVFVYNRTRSKAEPLEARGAVVCSDPAEAIGHAEAVVLMLSDARAIREVLEAVPEQVLAGCTFIQMGTISPQESCALARKLEISRGIYLECPVLGSRAEAQKGTLLLLAGAPVAVFETWEPLLSTWGPVRRIGDVGAAAVLKLAFNQLIASLICSFSVGLGMVERHGVPVDVFMDILRQSALYAPMFDKKLERLQKRNFADPNFPVEHLLKDIRLCAETAWEARLHPAHLPCIEQLLAECMRQGNRQQDYSAVFRTIAPER